MCLSYHCGIETKDLDTFEYEYMRCLSYHCGIETSYGGGNRLNMRSVYRTIVELKHKKAKGEDTTYIKVFIVPLWNWNSKSFDIAVVDPPCVYRTIVELKPLFAFFYNIAKVMCLSYHCGIETCLFNMICAKIDTCLSYHCGIETNETPHRGRPKLRCLSYHCGIETFSLHLNRAYLCLCLSYHCGIETNITLSVCDGLSMCLSYHCGIETSSMRCVETQL